MLAFIDVTIMYEYPQLVSDLQQRRQHDVHKPAAADS
jgi:hypothetical protein